MTDPFEALRSPYEPRPPREEFARRLRARVVAALGLDDGESIPTITLPERSRVMPATILPTTPTTPSTTATEVTPYLTVAGAAAALEWYSEAFGAVEEFRVVGDDGRLGHAEFTIGDARFMLADEYPEIGLPSPASLGGTPVALHVSVTAVDALFDRAVAAGATTPATASSSTRMATGGCSRSHWRPSTSTPTAGVRRALATGSSPLARPVLWRGRPPPGAELRGASGLPCSTGTPWPASGSWSTCSASRSSWW